MALHLAIPPVLATQKPLGRPVELDPRLRAAARSVFVLRDQQDSAVDELGNANLAFGATTAKPTWAPSLLGGQGLGFDGGDSCFGVITGFTYPGWVACSVVFNNLTGTQVGVMVGSAVAASGALIRIAVDAGGLNGAVRGQDGGGVATITGPAPIAGQLYHCSLLSRSSTDHVMYINGVRYVSTTSGGTGNNWVNAAIGCSRRGAVTEHFLNGVAHWAAYGTVDPGEALLRDLSVDPYSMIYAQSQLDFLLWRQAVLAYKFPPYAALQMAGG